MFLALLLPHWQALISLLVPLHLPTSIDWVQYLDFCFLSLLTYSVILSSHLAFNTIHRLMISTLRSAAQNSSLMSRLYFHLPTHQLTWVTNRHLKWSIPTLLSCCLSFFSRWQFHPSSWLDPKSCIHPWLLSFMLPVYSISKSFESYPKTILNPMAFYHLHCHCDAIEHYIPPGFLL